MISSGRAPFGPVNLSLLVVFFLCQGEGKLNTSISGCGQNCREIKEFPNGGVRDN